MKKLPKIISQEEFEQLLAATQKMGKSKNAKIKMKKFRIALLLGFEAGMRISEIVGYLDKVPALTKNNVESASIRVVSGKGSKDRIVPRPKRLNQTAVDLLPLKLKRRALQDFVTKLGDKVLKKQITFHTLRHGFASHLLNSGRPIHEVQMLLGHSRLDTTGVYLHANPIKAIEGARDIF